MNMVQVTEKKCVGWDNWDKKIAIWNALITTTHPFFQLPDDNRAFGCFVLISQKDNSSLYYVESIL